MVFLLLLFAQDPEVVSRPPHFPDRLHAFVFRNWSLVPVERMARVVGAKPEDVAALGKAMGLGEPPSIPELQWRRSYITIIRRNWHALPYEQLLELLGWTREKLDFTLREDDFLYHKLGNAKPACPPLRWAPPGEKAGARAREIAAILAEEFPGGATGAADPLFSFVERLSRPPEDGVPRREYRFSPRFCYSYFALYGDPLLEKEADPYPEGYLARLARAGVDGVWLQGVLHKLAPFPWEPARSERWEERLRSLGELVARAKRHGISLYLYLNEPRTMPVAFFGARAELKGVVTGDHAALCTSHPDVRKWLRESVARICREVPDLGGFFTITASENPTNCWSHGRGAQCGRCGKRKDAEVIGEVNATFLEGIRDAGSRARLIAWDWGWGWAAPSSVETIEQLPAGAEFMSISEWNLPIERGGVKGVVGEYSLSAVGPGPRATRHWEVARKRGLRTLAKIQAANSWELSAVPYIPAVENSALHAANLRRAGVDGLMLGWTLGGYPSPNLEVVAEVSSMEAPDAEAAMRAVAKRRFGEALAPRAVEAWRAFSAAFREFPFHVGVVYQAPLQMGPANPLWEAPTKYKATMVGYPYDDLDAWRAIYPPEVFASQLEKVADGFDRAAAALASAPSPALREELSVAEAAAIHFRSVANQARFVLARRAAASEGRRAALERLLRSELALAKRLHALQSADSRLGFEASNHYYYVPLDLAEKVLNCRDLLSRPAR